MKMNMNVNNKVWVKLNQNGLDELRRQHDHIKEEFPMIGDFIPPKQNSDGYVEFQLWGLMERLGHMCNIGFEPPFETDIILDVDDD